MVSRIAESLESWSMGAPFALAVPRCVCEKRYNKAALQFHATVAFPRGVAVCSIFE